MGYEPALDGVVAAVIFLEKATSVGARLTRPLAVALVALGIWVGAAPSSVPGLTQPTVRPQMKMQGGSTP
jgi:hypothetical protein